VKAAHHRAHRLGIVDRQYEADGPIVATACLANRLAQLDVGSETTVYGVTEDVPEILRYLATVGLRPGAHVTVFEKAPLGGPLTVGVGGKRHAISLELARMITVLPETAPSQW